MASLMLYSKMILLARNTPISHRSEPTSKNLLIRSQVKEDKSSMIPSNSESTPMIRPILPSSICRESLVLMLKAKRMYKESPPKWQESKILVYLVTVKIQRLSFFVLSQPIKI